MTQKMVLNELESIFSYLNYTDFINAKKCVTRTDIFVLVRKSYFIYVYGI